MRTILISTLAAMTLAGCEWLPWHPEPDAVAPRVTLAAPAAGTTVRADSVRVTGTARDSAGAVTRMLYAVGSGAEREVPVTPGREVSFAFTVTGLAPGSNTITVHAEDGKGNRGSQSVTVTYQPNRAPVAADDTASAWADSAVVVRVLANDTDPDGDSLRVSLVTQPSLGTATAGTDGTLRYVPNPSRSGTDSFRYAATDPRGAADTATVTVTVRPLPGPYSVTEITLPPITASGLIASSVVTRLIRVNNREQVLVARSYTERTGGLPGDVRTVHEFFIWENGQVRSVLTPVGGTDRQQAFDLDNLGQALVFTCTQTFGNQRSCVSYAYAIQTSPGNYRVLPYSGPDTQTGYLNGAGQAVLGSTLCTMSQCTPLPAVDGTAWTPRALNERGEIAGYATVSGNEVPVLYRGGQATTLQVAGSARATDINDSTWVVGTTTAGGGSVFVWRTGTVTLIPAPESPVYPQVNDLGQVIYGASLWEAGRAFALNTRLSDPTWEVVSAERINDAGQVVATARNRTTGATGMVLLTAQR